MTINHHPSEELLLDYAAGGLTEAWSLAVATHLALCPTCRRAVASMEAVAGSLVENILPVPVSDGVLDAVLRRLESDPAISEVATHGNAGGHPLIPRPLRGYVGSEVDAVAWKRLGMGAYQCLIPTGDNATARLLRIPAGRPVPQHTHRGLELTLVLQGAFSDATGKYNAGDFQEADEQLSHRPHAAEAEDCICLAVTEAPLRFKSLAARLAQPFLGI